MSSHVRIFASHALALCFSLAAAVPSGAAARVVGSAPDSSEVAALRDRLSSEPTILVIGTFGTREIRRPLVDATGVRSRAWEERAHRRPALVVIGQAARPVLPPPIAWSQISEVQVGGASAARGALIGTLIGALIGVGMTASGLFDLTSSEFPLALVIVPSATLGGAAAGTMVSSAIGWKTVYRAPVDRAPPPRAR
jgi:hypothetical protein